MYGFKVLRPASLEEALEIKAALLDNGRFLAGGTDLIVQARDNKHNGRTFIDISKIKVLSGIEEKRNGIRIGPLVTMREMVESELLKKYAPALVMAAEQVGAPAIRNRATIGGNIVNASPAGDTIPPLFTLDGELELLSCDGVRRVPVKKFYTGPGRSILKENEILFSIILPRKEDMRGIFLKTGARKALAISKVSIALSAVVKKNKIAWASAALGAAGPTVMECEGITALLTGKTLCSPDSKNAVSHEGGASGYAELIEKVGCCAENEARPICDIRSTDIYRRHVAGVLAKRAVAMLIHGRERNENSYDCEK